MGRGGSIIHIVQIGWDAQLLEDRAASDSRERQAHYARLLEAKRPGSRMTICVLGAPREARPWQSSGLSALPFCGRWTGLVYAHRALGRLNQASPISVIAAQSPFEDGWLALTFSRGRIPVVAQAHFEMHSDAALPVGSKLRSALGAARRRLAMRLLPSFGGVRVVASEMCPQFKAAGARDVRVIPVPIFDIDRLRAVAALPRAEPRVLFVGRLAPEKNLDLWLDVARRVVAVVPEARFDVVGEGASRALLESRASAMGLGDAIEFHGGKTRNALPAYFERATVFLLTSDHEGFGRVLIEAMAAGTAVVSTRTGGAREIIGTSEAGLVADVGDAGGLASHVISLLTDASLRQRTIAAASAVVGRYDPLRLANAWVDMLIEAAERKHSPQKQN